MDIPVWLARAKELSIALDLSSDFGAAAVAALDLARHRTALLPLDWGNVVPRLPVEAILDLTAELPAPQRVHLRVRIAASLIRSGRREDGQKLVDSLSDTVTWPVAALYDLSPSWAVILADRPELLPVWLSRTCSENCGQAFQCLSLYASDHTLTLLVGIAGTAGNKQAACGLIGAMTARGRVTALQLCPAISLKDSEGVAGDPEVQIRTTAQIERCRHLLAAGREAESVALSRELAGSLAPFAAAARKLKHLPALRTVLDSPPAACGGLFEWYQTAEELAGETTLAEVWPFFEKAGPQNWNEEYFLFEDMVDRGIVTGELELAENFVALVPEELRPSLRARLALAGIRDAGQITSSRLRHMPNWLRLWLSAKQKGRMELLARLAAGDIVSGSARRGFRLLRRLGDEEWQEKEDDQEEEGEEEEVDVMWIVLDICGALKKLGLLVNACVQFGKAGLEWDWPGSLMNLAVARFYRMEGFEAAFGVCRRLPAEARKEALEELIECLAGDGKVEETLRLVWDPDSGVVVIKPAVAAVHEMASKGEKAAAAQLAQFLIGKLRNVDTEEAREALRNLSALVEANESGDVPAPWPAVEFSGEEKGAVLPPEYWQEMTEAEIDRRTEALRNGTDPEGHHPISVIRWRRLSLLYTVRSVMDAPAEAAKWLEISASEAAEAGKRWPNPPVAEEYFESSRNDGELAAPVKAAIFQRNEPLIRQWLECLMQLTEQCPADSPGRRFRLLDLLARFSLAGHSLPDFKERAGRMMADCPPYRDPEFALGRARAFLALEDWSRLQAMLFEETANLALLFIALREFAWRFPNEFMLQCRHEFARCVRSAHWMTAIAAVRGEHPESAVLVNAAGALNTNLFEGL